MSAAPPLELHVLIGGQRYRVDLAHPHDLSVGVRFAGQRADAFGLPPAEQRPFAVPGFVADTALGASCNVRHVTLCPHGDGTHTESAQHLDHRAPSIAAVAPIAPIVAWVATATPIEEGGDLVVTPSGVDDALRRAASIGSRALIVRTGQAVARGAVAWSHTNPPYLHADALSAVRAAGIEHLLVDLPSVDRESDGGAMAAHRAFFGGREAAATITEMIIVPDSLPDGPALLWLATPNIDTDAVPSRPTAFALSPAE